MRDCASFNSAHSLSVKKMLNIFGLGAFNQNPTAHRADFIARFFSPKMILAGGPTQNLAIAGDFETFNDCFANFWLTHKNN